MTFRIHYTVPRPLGGAGRRWATLGEFASLEEARDHADWAAKEYDSDVEIFEIETRRVVDEVPAPS
jgi:hypothetical protein